MTTTDRTAHGTVLWSMGHQARVFVDGEQLLVDIPGKWRLDGQGRKPLAPGDWVSLANSGDGWRLGEILPRKNKFIRRTPGRRQPIPQLIAANLDLILIVASTANPRTPTGIVDRMLVAAELGGVKPILVVNKIDLVKPEDALFWRSNYCLAVDEVLFTSCATYMSINVLARRIANRTVLLAGSSGVGKSTLANCIDANLNLKTSEISQATGKGRHTTSTAQLFPITKGGWLGDTPGMREFAPYGMTPDNLNDTFPEIRKLSQYCKFRNCRHRREIGCIVHEAVDTSELPRERYESYLKLLHEAEASAAPNYR